MSYLCGCGQSILLEERIYQSSTPKAAHIALHQHVSFTENNNAMVDEDHMTLKAHLCYF